MRNLTALRCSLMLAALWWGALTGMSFVAVPLMFAKLGPVIAGPVAAKLFSIQCWIGLLIGLVLLLLLRRQRDAVASSAQAMESMRALLSTMGIVVFAMLLAMLQEFGVAQNIVSARATGGNLRLWHRVGSVMVLGQWLCSATVLWRLSRGAALR